MTISPVFLFDRPTPTLEQLELLPPLTEPVISGDPVQHGNSVHTDESVGLFVGTWHCTPYTTAMDYYGMDEFMVILQGCVVIVHEDGSRLTVKAGESFFMPKGLKCQWVMEQPVLKHYVIYDDGTPAQRQYHPEQRAVKFQAANLETERLMHTSPSRRFKVLQWRNQMPQAVADHFVYVVSGELELQLMETRVCFKAGESVFIPKHSLIQMLGSSSLTAISCLFT